MNVKFKFLLAIVIAFASCGTHNLQTDNQGFGGGHCKNTVVINRKLAKPGVTNEQIQTNMDLANLQFEEMQINDQNASENIGSQVTPEKLTVAKQVVSQHPSKEKVKKFIYKELLPKLESKIDQIESSVIRLKSESQSSSWGTFQKVCLILGTILLIATFVFAYATQGGNSSNYYLVGLIFGLMAISTIILLMTGLSYHRLGKLGKIGLLLTAISPLTFGITALVGLPLWLIGCIWKM